jgi:hypothetical protein
MRRASGEQSEQPEKRLRAALDSEGHALDRAPYGRPGTRRTQLARFARPSNLRNVGRCVGIHERLEIVRCRDRDNGMAGWHEDLRGGGLKLLRAHAGDSFSAARSLTTSPAFYVLFMCKPDFCQTAPVEIFRERLAAFSCSAARWRRGSAEALPNLTA